MVSFTFDDFPRSALTVGGEILRERGLRGTYYCAMGLRGREATKLGPMFVRRDLDRLLEAGHELACHTFDHVSCHEVACAEFIASCARNRQAQAEIHGGREPRSFSFPFGDVSLATKTALATVYDTCRTIEGGVNRGCVDLAYLRANHLYSQRDLMTVKRTIADAAERPGWVILYTHDVALNPSPWGCTPTDFQDVLSFAVECGAGILTVSDAVSRFSPVPQAGSR